MSALFIVDRYLFFSLIKPFIIKALYIMTTVTALAYLLTPPISMPISESNRTLMSMEK